MMCNCESNGEKEFEGVIGPTRIFLRVLQSVVQSGSGSNDIADQKKDQDGSYPAVENAGVLGNENQSEKQDKKDEDRYAGKL